MMPFDEIQAMFEKRREQEQMAEATKRAAVSGGLGGAVLGGISSIAGGQKSLGGALRAAALGGLSGAGIGGASQALGQSIAGPAEGEPGGHANRGLLGGAVAGGLGGLALGGLLGSGKLGWLSKIAPVARALEGEGVLNNLATDQIKKMMAKGQRGRIAASLGIGGAAAGGLHGWGEGLDADYSKSLEDDEEP